jgi:VanZ family protein
MTRSRLAAVLLDPRFQVLCTRSAFIIYLLILLVGSIPGARQEIGEYAPGGVLHALAYAGLTVLMFLGRGKNVAERALGSVIVAAALGAGDEFVQSFLPYRGASWLDWGVDIAASLAAAAAMIGVYPRLTPGISGRSIF